MMRMLSYSQMLVFLLVFSLIKTPEMQLVDIASPKMVLPRHCDNVGMFDDLVISYMVNMLICYCRPIARMPAAVRGSPLIKVHKPSYSEESASDTVGRTSTSTYTFGTPGTPFTEEDTGTVATQTISSLDDTTRTTNKFADKPAAFAKVSQATDATYKSSSGSSELQHPRFLNRLSLKDFSQSSLHLTGPLQRPDTSLNNIAELADTSPAGRGVAAPASKPYSKTHVAMRTSAPHLHNMRISQHLRSLSYYSDDAEQVPGAHQPQQKPMVESKQDTLEQPQSGADSAPKICLKRDETTKDKSSHSTTRRKNFVPSSQLSLDTG
jgi:hypothetical protein